MRGHIIRGLEDRPEKLAFRQIFLDTAQFAKIVMSFPEVDATRVSPNASAPKCSWALD
jgi:cephalosporin-C deacetylase